MKPELKHGKLIASVLFILLGFCAGAGMNLLPRTFFLMTGTVHGAPGDPNPALKSVAHDRTLAGDGTASAPLGIANGGVSAPKLSPAAPPSAGQLLGFNGANLAWQDATVGGVRVVDSLGQLVGPLIGYSSALRKVGNSTFAIQVVPSGFPDNGAFQYSYTSPDCSGTQYLQVSRPELITPSRQSGSVLEYVTGPFERVTINSYETSTPTFCQHFPNNDTNIYGRGATFDLSTLGLVPPFHLEF
jgi:hypothetical protein